MTMQDLIDEWYDGTSDRDPGRRLASALLATGPVLSHPEGHYPAVYRGGNNGGDSWWIESRVIPEASEPLYESAAYGELYPTPEDFDPAAVAARLGLPLASAVAVPD